MKLIPLLLLIAAANAAEPLKMETLALKSGKTYQSVTFVEKRADGVTIHHAGGVARIPHEDLPKQVADQLGGFDKAAAEKARKEDAEKVAKNEAAHDVEARPAGDTKDAKSQPTRPGQANAGADGKPAKVEPKNADKLLVKRVSFGDGVTSLEISAKAGSKSLEVTYGPTPPSSSYQTFTVPAWGKQVQTVRVYTKYSVTASEGGAVVDKEGAIGKTGLGGDTKLR